MINIHPQSILPSPLFRGVEERDLPGLLDCLSAQMGHYGKNEFVFRAGEEARSVGIVCAGAVQVIKEDFTGNRTILAKVGEGGLFGESFACAGSRHLTVSVQAAQDSEILFIRYSKLISTCPTACVFHSKLIENMLGILAAKNLMLNGKIEVLARRTTREKLVAYLSEQARSEGSNHFTLPFNRQELADYLCVDRSAMSAELSRMQREGLLRYDRSEFWLLEEQ